MANSESKFFYVGALTEGSSMQRKTIESNKVIDYFKRGYIVGIKATPYDRYYVPSELTSIETMGPLKVTYLCGKAIEESQDEKASQRDISNKEKLGTISRKSGRRGCELFIKSQSFMYSFLNSPDCEYSQYVQKLSSTTKSATAQQAVKQTTPPLKPQPQNSVPEAKPQRDYEGELKEKDKRIIQLQTELRKAEEDKRALDDSVSDKETELLERDTKIEDLETKVETMGGQIESMRTEIERYKKLQAAYAEKERECINIKSSLTDLEEQNRSLLEKLSLYEEEKNRKQKAKEEFKEKYVGKGKKAVIKKREGENIRLLRQEGYTIEAIAVLLGHSPTTISKILKELDIKKPSKEEIKRVQEERQHQIKSKRYKRETEANVKI